MHGQLANAARVKYPAALQRCKLDTPLLAAGYLIDLDSHTDYKYGLTEDKMDGREIAAYYGFTPCHYAVGTEVLPNLALDEKAFSIIDDEKLHQLALDNKTITEKCRTALLNNGISEEQLGNSLAIHKLFGC